MLLTLATDRAYASPPPVFRAARQLRANYQSWHSTSRQLLFEHSFEHLLPALQLLLQAGYQYLSPNDSERLRNNALRQALLPPIVRQQLQRINPVMCGSAALTAAFLQLQASARDSGALLRLLQNGYRHETLHVQFIDWRQPENNSFHVCPSFPVEAATGYRLAYPDLVLFVNGIPLLQIDTANLEHIDAYRPHPAIAMLAPYLQLTLICNRQQAYYSAPQALDWSAWQGPNDDAAIGALLAIPLAAPIKAALFDWLEQVARRLPPLRQTQAISAQERILFSLCRPAGLLAFLRAYLLPHGPATLFAAARQYAAIERILHESKNRQKMGLTVTDIIYADDADMALLLALLARRLQIEYNLPIIVYSCRAGLAALLAQTGLQLDKASSPRALNDALAKPAAQIILFDCVHARRMHITRPFYMLCDKPGYADAPELCVAEAALLLQFYSTPPLDAGNRFRLDCYTLSQARQQHRLLPLYYSHRTASSLKRRARQIAREFRRHYRPYGLSVLVITDPACEAAYRALFANAGIDTRADDAAQILIATMPASAAATFAIARSALIGAVYLTAAVDPSWSNELLLLPGRQKQKFAGALFDYTQALPALFPDAQPALSLPAQLLAAQQARHMAAGEKIDHRTILQELRIASRRTAFYRENRRCAELLATALTHIAAFSTEERAALRRYRHQQQHWQRLQTALQWRYAEIPQTDAIIQQDFRRQLNAHGVTGLSALADAYCHHGLAYLAARQTAGDADAITALIEAYQTRQLSAAEYWRQAQALRNTLLQRMEQPCVAKQALQEAIARTLTEQYGVAAQLPPAILAQYHQPGYWHNRTALSATENALDDFIAEKLDPQLPTSLSAQQKDQLIRQIMQLAYRHLGIT